MGFVVSSLGAGVDAGAREIEGCGGGGEGGEGEGFSAAAGEEAEAAAGEAGDFDGVVEGGEGDPGGVGVGLVVRWGGDGDGRGGGEAGDRGFFLRDWVCGGAEGVDGCARGLHGVFRRERGKPVGGRCFGGHGVTFNSAGVKGEVDSLADLDAIVGPQTIGFPKDGYGATVLDGDPGQRILRYHFVEVDQSFSIFRLARWCLRSSIPIVGVSALEPAGAVWFEMSIRQ